MEKPPDQLTEQIESGLITPCKTIDLGCGAGNNSVYLAKKGFEVTGVDISQTAIKYAVDNAKKHKIDCRFMVMDLARQKFDLNDKFDFAFEWEVLHHIFPEQRIRYLNNVFSLLNSNAQYLSVSFSIEDSAFGGKGKIRETPLGTMLYFSTLNELIELFSGRFKVLESKVIGIRGLPDEHRANYILAQKCN
jgi:cyclopropane fatty-acyl-phospholipid synthase-like methyltransferase